MPLHWNAQLVRATLFLEAPIDGSGLWHAIVGQEPAVDENRPREGLRQQAGPLDEAGTCMLQTTVTNERLDMILIPTPTELLPYQPIVIGEVGEAVARFSDVVCPWLETADFSVAREAFGLVAVSPEPDRETAYADLARLVPSVRYDATTTREVVYQVNRPIASRVLTGTMLNRITKWSAMITHMHMIRPAGIAVPHGEPHQSVRCECDNSTPAERREALPERTLRAIYEELRSLALDNLERGEIA